MTDTLKKYHFPFYFSIHFCNVFPNFPKDENFIYLFIVLIASCIGTILLLSAIHFPRSNSELFKSILIYRDAARGNWGKNDRSQVEEINY